MSDFRGLIVAVSGPSGVGKGTVLARVEELLEEANPGSVGHSISVTTRAPRGQEKDGVEYYFRTKEEFEQMKRHASEGGRIVHEILDDYEDPEYIQITADIAKHHHEKWNGTGYPDNLKGEEIPLCARIMAIADVFDALVSPRIYKSPMSYEEAFNIIKEGSSIHFDPVIAEEFLNIKEKASAVNESFKGTM